MLCWTAAAFVLHTKHLKSHQGKTRLGNKLTNTAKKKTKKKTKFFASPHSIFESLLLWHRALCLFIQLEWITWLTPLKKKLFYPRATNQVRFEFKSYLDEGAVTIQLHCYNVANQESSLKACCITVTSHAKPMFLLNGWYGKTCSFQIKMRK